jgi:hypothetical protein
MEKAILCTPEEMSRLQYVEENKMLFEERLKLAFGMLELYNALVPKSQLNVSEDSGIEWITLKMVND